VSQVKYESRLHRAVRRAIAQRIRIGKPFMRHDGQMVYPVGRYLLTGRQLVDLDSRGELTSWGIREFAEGRFCPDHHEQMQETAELDVPDILFFFCPEPGCKVRYSERTGYISIDDLPSSSAPRSF
jgi:hypothetical protein